MNRIVATFFSLLLLGCNKFESENITTNLSPETPLKIYLTTTTSTRGELIEKEDNMSSISLFCAYTADKNWTKKTLFEKMYDRSYIKADEGGWIAEGESETWGYKSLKDKYTFFAYSPYRSEVNGIDPDIINGELNIKYTVPANSADQPDLMFAVPLKNSVPQIEEGVPLDFRHTLASVSFGLRSNNGVKINTIKISGVADKGILKWNYDSNAPKWKLSGDNSNYFTVKMNNYTLNGNTAVQVNSNDGYLMMIPQQLEDGAEVSLSLDNGQTKKIYIAPGVNWKAGIRYHYTFNIGEDNDFIYDSSQISNCYMIHPTQGETTIIQIPIQDRINDFWINYSGDRKNFTKITGNTDTENLFIEMVWEDFEGTPDYDKGFVVDSEGKLAVEFKFYSDNQLGNFVFAIRKPSTSEFKDTLWSWHLWFTDYNPDAIAYANRDKINIGDDNAYTATDYKGEVHRYKDDENAVDTAKVWNGIYRNKFIMDRNIGERDAYAKNFGAGTVYYQFGRKDPFPGNGATYLDGTTELIRRWETGGGYYKAVDFCINFLCGEYSPHNWCDEKATLNKDHIWYDGNIDAVGYSTGKSIFDPSPLGWRVPVYDTWNYFNATGSTEEGKDKIKSVWKYNPYGMRSAKNEGDIDDFDIGYCWSANQYDANYGYCLYYTDEVVKSSQKFDSANALPVRAIEE